MTQQTSYFGLGGGMDLITPAVQLSLTPGRAVAALNYEPVGAGYRRLRGFERFDGQQAPSSATYAVAYFTNGNAAMADAVAGTTGTQGTPVTAVTLLIPPVLQSGSYAAGTAAGYIVVVVHHGAGGASNISFSEGVGASATLTGAFVPNDTSTGGAYAAWAALAPTYARAAIAAVGAVISSTGPVRGIWFLNGDVLVARDNAGATAGNLFRSDPASWQAIGTSYVLPFTSGGTSEIGTSGIQGATSGATATVHDVILASGSWAGGDAAGTLLVSDVLGTFVAENINQGAALNIATIAGAPTAYELPAGGRYEFISHNFYGASDLTRVYGVNGVGNAFVYDPDADLLSKIIVTGMATDTPNHIEAYRGSLFLSFPGGSLQFSAVGEPTSFDAVIGAGEIGVGSNITGLVTVPNGLAILACNSINILYGNDSSDYQLEVLTNEAGALAHTAQRIGSVIYMDNRGLRSLSASQAFGNFSMGTISKLIEPLLKDYREDGIEPVASLVARASDQYWLFFDNGAGIIVYMGAKQPSILPFNLGKTVTCAASVEDDGEERLFIGCSDGFVYELNKGTSFDGAAIEHYIRLPFNHFGSPQQLKRIHKAMIDLEATGTTTLSVSAEINYGAEAGIAAQTLAVTTGGGAIDSLGSNELYFASQIETIAEAYLDGVCKNISLKIGGSTSTEQPHTLTGVTFHVSPRGLQR